LSTLDPKLRYYAAIVEGTQFFCAILEPVTFLEALERSMKFFSEQYGYTCTPDAYPTFGFTAERPNLTVQVTIVRYTPIPKA
jgi:hypothetical protein